MRYLLSSPLRGVLGLVMFTLAGCTGPEDGLDTGSEVTVSEPEGAVVEELLVQLDLVEEKVVALAGALGTDEYSWRPGEGVRSTGEVFMHMTTMNYAFPIFAGHPAPTSTGLTAANIGSEAPAFEASLETKEDISPELARSFQHLRSAIADTTPASLEDPVTVFGTTTTTRAFWIDHVGHLREHLGQLIAYARTMGVVPPWS